MTRMFSQLVAEAGLENAVGMALYVAAVVAFVVALRRVIRHRRVRRELRLVHDAAYRERPQRGSYVA